MKIFESKNFSKILNKDNFERRFLIEKAGYFIDKFFTHYSSSLVLTVLLVLISVYSQKYIPEWFNFIKKDRNGLISIDDTSVILECDKQIIKYVQHSDGEGSLYLKQNGDFYPIKDDAISSACGNRYMRMFFDGRLSREGVLYLVMVFSFGIIFLIKEQKNEKKLRDKEDDLSRSIQTMPPYNVIKRFYEGVSIMVQYDVRIKKEEELARESSSSDFSQVVESIKSQRLRYVRSCLDSISQIAKDFHNASNGMRFAANIMLIQKTTDVMKDENLLVHLMHFSSYDTLDDLVKNESKFLVLAPELSSSTDRSNESSRDDLLQKKIILLPIPDDGVNLIPGAPSAFVHLNDTIFDCQSVFKGSSYPKVLPKVKSALDAYFNSEQGKHIRSILSIRIADGNGDKISGVLNIHSDLCEMFTNLDKKHMFIQLISPMLFKLHHLLSGD